ncbi:MAG: polysaccharide deacetylase family protein, partial [Eubacteriales bacterium]|nr:polysaccharide deacetylase family protein [Eubacteriales bacterium]
IGLPIITGGSGGGGGGGGGTTPLQPTSEVASIDSLGDINVENGTISLENKLPKTVAVLLSDNSTVNANVTWDAGTPAYNGNLPGAYLFSGTLVGVNNPKNYKANAKVIVGPVTVTSVDQIKDRIVIYGTEKANIGLPKTIEITLSNHEKARIDVGWINDSYNGKLTGDYTFTGALALPADILNPQNVVPGVKVTVYKGINPNPLTPLNSSQGTTIYPFDHVEEWWDDTTKPPEFAWWKATSAALEVTSNSISDGASIKFTPLDSIPYSDYYYFSGITSGAELGSKLANMENMEFGIYIPENETVDFIQIKLFTNNEHTAFFENAIGGWELASGWNKIRRMKEDFTPGPNETTAVESEDIETFSARSLISTPDFLDQNEQLRQKIDQLNKHIADLRIQSILEQSDFNVLPVENTSLPVIEEAVKDAAAEEEALADPETATPEDEDIVEEAKEELMPSEAYTMAAEAVSPSWNHITRMEFIVAYKEGNLTSINVDTIAFNTSGKAKLLFTFDDAWLSVITNGKPILDTKGFKGTTWANKEAAEGHWNTGAFIFMDIDDLQEIYEAGWDIGNHTVGHPDDESVLTDEELIEQYQGNQEWIEGNSWLRGARHVCYPSGSYSDRLISILQEMGVKSARTTVHGITPIPVTDMYKLKCIAVGRDTDIDKYVLDEIDRAVETGSTLFFMFHRVEEIPEPDDNNENYGQIAVSIENLQRIVDYASGYVQSGELDVVTISEWFESYLGNETYPD